MGFLLSMDSKAICAHSGQVQCMTPDAKVFLDGKPAVVQTGTFVVSGCTNPTPPANVGPCVSVTWLSGSTKITIGGKPALLMDSKALATPTGGSASVVSAQGKVSGV
jgi:hypothetical protein